MYPHNGDDSIVYYRNLHLFKTKSWLSIGLKPKAKDLKTVIDDLKQMEYLQQIYNQEYITNTIVLDGRKVRLGFEGSALDVMMTKHADNAKLIKSICNTMLPDKDGNSTGDDNILQSEFEFKFTIG